MPLTMPRPSLTAEHEMFRRSFRQFAEREMVPHLERWTAQRLVDRDLYAKAGRAGFLCMEVPEQYGGAGVDDFHNNMMIAEELQHADLGGCGLGLTLHNDICLPYFLRYTTEEQRQRWLPGIVSGDLITAIAMTEPGTGSDLAAVAATAVRDGDSYIVNGAKTFITNGINADLVITVVKTDPAQRHRGISLLVIERGTPGFERGRNLEKLGQHAQDTAELFFADCRVPVDNLLGQDGQGFKYLMLNLPRERLSIAVTGVAAAVAALDRTLSYVKERQAFGQAIGSFQHSRFLLAELQTEVEIAQVFIDRCVTGLGAGVLTAEQAAMAKWWCTDLQNKVLYHCVQLHGGFGYMRDNPVARAFADARVTPIYGGTNEIMKEIIGRSLGL